LHIVFVDKNELAKFSEIAREDREGEYPKK
jgi:hypothetical protein